MSTRMLLMHKKSSSSRGVITETDRHVMCAKGMGIGLSYTDVGKTSTHALLSQRKWRPDTAFVTNNRLPAWLVLISVSLKMARGSALSSLITKLCMVKAEV